MNVIFSKFTILYMFFIHNRNLFEENNDLDFGREGKIINCTRATACFIEINIVHKPE